MSNEERARLRAGNFIHNNGLVLRIINILRYKYNRLTGVKDVVAGHGVSEDEYLDSVNFLAEEGYIRLRLAADQDARIAGGQRLPGYRGQAHRQGHPPIERRYPGQSDRGVKDGREAQPQAQ